MAITSVETWAVLSWFLLSPAAAPVCMLTDLPKPTPSSGGSDEDTQKLQSHHALLHFSAQTVLGAAASATCFIFPFTTQSSPSHLCPLCSAPRERWVSLSRAPPVSAPYLMVPVFPADCEDRVCVGKGCGPVGLVPWSTQGRQSLFFQGLTLSRTGAFEYRCPKHLFYSTHTQEMKGLVWTTVVPQDLHILHLRSVPLFLVTKLKFEMRLDSPPPLAAGVCVTGRPQPLRKPLVVVAANRVLALALRVSAGKA